MKEAVCSLYVWAPDRYVDARSPPIGCRFSRPFSVSAGCVGTLSLFPSLLSQCRMCRYVVAFPVTSQSVQDVSVRCRFSRHFSVSAGCVSTLLLFPSLLSQCRMYQYVDARSPPIRCYLLGLDHDLDLDRDLDLDFDAHCKCDTPTGPSLGYSVSGQGGST